MIKNKIKITKIPKSFKELKQKIKEIKDWSIIPI